jgi:PKD repeat protein
MKRVLGIVLIAVGAAWGGAHWEAAAAPIAEFTFSPSDADVNTEVTLDASASRSSGGRIVRYEWDFDGDGQYEESLESHILVHLFDEGGRRTVTLRVTDQAGEQSMVSKEISVRPAVVTVRRTITGPIAPNRVPAGSAFQVTVTIKIHQAVNGLGLDEDLPQGWRVGSVETGGAIFKGSETQWLWFQTLNPGDTLKVIYNVTVGSGTAAGIFTINGIVSSFSPRFEISVPGDHEVRVI